ncbi:MAG: SbcC/MukB-like Walker B domain-containing protein [Bacteroidota bacterium]
MSNFNKDGYRLHQIEIFNWGTFDENIWKLNPTGKNSLLTGANGSGKTTLVDAIITLLVPPNKRHYNQSSGSTSKRERDEKTYTLGAYVTVQSESGLAVKTKHLRTKDDFSILLAVFYNNITRQYYTLAQVRWFSNNDLRKVYLTAPRALNIEEHFTPLDSGGAWKRTLKKKFKAEEHDSFTKYSHAFTREFGLKSDKALTLFAQTVGIKVLGNLNEFIRTNMLEEYDAEGDFVELRAHYENLLQSHRSIEKARIQLELLEPIVADGKAFQEQEKGVKRLEQLTENIAPFFAEKRIGLLEEMNVSLATDLDKKGAQINEIKYELNQLGTQHTELRIALNSNQGYERVKNIEQQISQLEREKDQRQQKAKRYAHLAEKLDLKDAPNERTFYKSLENSRKEITRLEEEVAELREKELELQIQLNEQKSTFKTQEKRLISLQKRTNRLPIEQIRIREALVERLGVNENDVPFAAELIQVKAEEKDWEMAIEHTLRPLALTLIIREKYFEETVKFAFQNHLNGKIKFRKVEEIEGDFSKKVGKNSLLQKIKLRDTHLLSDWLEKVLKSEYNYTCTNGYGTIAKQPFSINDKSLIRREYHIERDDSKQTQSTDYQILGWDNRETILEAQKQLRDTQSEIERFQQTIQVNKNRRADLTERRDRFNLISTYQEFPEIDWKSSEKSIKNLEKEKDSLLNTSNQLQELERQLSDVKSQISKTEENRDKLVEQRGTLQNRLENYEQQLQEAKELLAEFDLTALEKKRKTLEGHLEGESVYVSTIQKVENRITRNIRDELARANHTLAKTEKRLTLGMQRFISPSPEILEIHPNWTSDTINLSADIRYLPEFEDIHDKIKQEDLPKYQKRFKDWLNERLIFDIANFKTALENKEVQIIESIEEINASLQDINFSSTPLTYIQLDINKSRDTAIRDFKDLLRDAMPDPAKLIQGDEAELEASFQKIRKIIEELSNNESWRKKVTDVRNWLEFAAIERHRADNSQKQYYVDSQSLSGGEKAKLAYTILASAIAYQFGIRDGKKRSFRFAVVDEAFSKVDPENAVYAMELFKQLNLQLMVVTPLDKINLAEPYINSVHFVQNKAKKNSEVFDLPMEIYQKQKTAFQAA